MKYAATIKQKKSPCMGDPRGYEVIVAVVNRARFCVLSQDYVQSFARKWELVSFPIIDLLRPEGTPSIEKAQQLLAVRHPSIAKEDIEWM